MEIAVQSTKLLKEGVNKSGAWELWRVTTPDKTEYTTFDKSVKYLGEGAVIDIGEPKIKENKLSFEKVVKVIREGMPQPGKGGQEDSPEKRASIEAQKAVELVMNSYTQLAVATLEIEPKLEKLWDKALNWCGAKIMVGQRTETKPAPPAESEPPFPEDEPVDDEHITIEQLLNKVCEAKGFKQPATAMNWLTKWTGKSEEQINSDPVSIWKEIKPNFG